MARAAAFLAGILLLAAAVLSATPARAAGRSAASCKIAFAAAADGSFEQAGYDASPARLASLVAVTRDRLAAAARALCAKGVLSPADLARLRKLVVQNGEGATEPLLYRDPAMGPHTIIFQFAFQDGKAPDAAAFEQALRCWKRPESPACSGD